MEMAVDACQSSDGEYCYHNTVSQKCHVSKRGVLAIACWRVIFHIGVTKVSRHFRLLSKIKGFHHCLEVCVCVGFCVKVLKIHDRLP